MQSHLQERGNWTLDPGPHVQNLCGSAPWSLPYQWWGSGHTAWHHMMLKRSQCWGSCKYTHPRPDLLCAGDPVPLLNWCRGEGACWSGSVKHGKAQPGLWRKMGIPEMSLLLTGQSAAPESGPYGRNPEPCALVQYTLCCWMSIHRQSTYCSKACKKQV